MPFKRLTTTALATMLLAGIAIVAPVQVASAAGVLPSGFSDESVITGLSLPTSVEFAPNGKIFITEKAGRVKMFDSLSDTSPTLTADLRTQVYNYWDKGLLGLAVDPQYPSRPYIYVLYSYDAYIGEEAPLWGEPDTNGDPCLGSPNGPGSTVDGCVSSARLSRLTLNGSGEMTSERVLVNDWCNQYYSHNIGTVAFGDDGYLYAGGGDGADPATSNIDYGQKGGTIMNPSTGDPYTPKNPCGDPTVDVGETMPKETAQGGALRAQSKRRPQSQPTTLDGSIIRIDPDTGNAINTNQNYYDGRDENDRRIVSFGLRNPFRFTFKPNTNELWVADVGAGTWEEINRIQNPIGAMTNHGWPCYEGNVKMGSWDNANINSCENLYAGGSAAIAEPYYVYRHNQTLFEDDTCVTSGGSITGIAFEDGSNYPSKYDGALFFADFARDCIWVMRKGTNGLPDATKVEVFEKDAAGPVELQSGPDGNIYYADLDGGAIHRISYSAGNQPPDIDATASPTSGPAPLQVNFDASDTTDPENDSISFAWDLDNDGSYDDDTGATASRTYSTGTHHPSVRATDEHGASSTFDFTIVSGNSAPQPVIDTPSDGTKWAVGQEINLTGHATDAQDGNLASSRLSWRVIMHHCTGATAADCHEHIVEDRDATSGFSFDAPDHEYPSHMEIELTARDSGGLETTVSRILQPKTVQVTFATNPSGLKITAAGENKSGPWTVTFIQGSEIALDAPTSQTVGGVSYSFSSWSDGGSRVHNIKAPSSNTTYTANYSSNGTADIANACADANVGSSRVDLQACKLEYSIVSPK